MGLWVVWGTSPRLAPRVDNTDLDRVQDREEFTPFVQQHLFSELRPCSPLKSVAQQIAERNALAPDNLKTIIFRYTFQALTFSSNETSHAHWDHCRPFWNTFPSATGLFGPGTFEHCQPGHQRDPSAQWDGRTFDDPAGLQKCRELEGPWIEFGPFEHAMDFFGNGSFWIMQAPGHMPGNLIAAARLSTGVWVIMAGDCCHARLAIKQSRGRCISLTASQANLRRSRRFRRVHSAGRAQGLLAGRHRGS